MRAVLFLLRKEFVQVLRDRVFLTLLVVPPFVQLLIITSAATFEVKSLDLHLVDRDRTPASRTLARSFAASGRFEIDRTSSSDSAARRELVADEVEVLLRIPAGFARDLARGPSAEVQLVFDGSDGTTAGIARSYAGEILRGFAADREREAGASPAHPLVTDRTGTRVAAEISAPRLEVRSRTWYNPRQDYDDFMAPGILVILITVVGTVTTALNIAREREQGTIEQLNVTPITKGQFVAGKLTPFWILGILELAFGVLLVWVVFDIPVRGSLPIVFLGGGIYLLSALALGLMISTASETQQQAQFLAFFLIVVYLFLSGIFTPVESMPGWAQTLADVNPMKHFVALVRAVLLRGAGLAEIRAELVALTAFAVVTLPLSVRLHSKTAA